MNECFDEGAQFDSKYVDAESAMESIDRLRMFTNYAWVFEMVNMCWLIYLIIYGCLKLYDKKCKKNSRHS